MYTRVVFVALLSSENRILSVPKNAVSAVAMADVWLGRVEYAAAVRCGRVVIDGPPALVKQVPLWLMWSPMARFVRAASRL